MEYPYGAANSVPHIHVYGGDMHLKILVGSSVKRINLIQGGKRYEDNIAQALEIAQQHSADLYETLVAMLAE